MTYAKALVDNARQRTLYLRIWPSPIFECALVLIAHISLGREPKPETLANVRFRAHNGLKSDIAPCPKSAPGSTGRRNTGVKSLRWGFKLQGLAWSFVELTRHFVQISLGVHREVGALGEVLSQQTIGILI